MTRNWTTTLSSLVKNISQWKKLKSSHWLNKSDQLTSELVLWCWATSRRALQLSAQFNRCGN
jgi:hypothetical protein